ncbi:MAG TPA: hypothetical protein DCF68_08475 [Cyanothece sp. UBA12306]|nr:hypothetical protein [Cyanothece sp. UBA12306]
MKSTDIPSQQLSEAKSPVEQQKLEKESKLINNNKKKLKLGRWLLLTLILGGSVGTWQIINPSTVPKAQTSTQTPPPKPVETVTLSLGTGSRKFRLLGQVEAGKKATLNPQIDGIVQQILVKEGDRVKPGMTVAILDDADAKIALAEAKARLIQEKSNLAKLKAGTRTETIDQRKAELQAAQAREKEAQENLQSLINLQPDLINQRRAELEVAIAREKEAEDNLARIRDLSLKGALSQRTLVGL